MSCLLERICNANGLWVLQVIKWAAVEKEKILSMMVICWLGSNLWAYCRLFAFPILRNRWSLLLPCPISHCSAVHGTTPRFPCSHSTFTFVDLWYRRRMHLIVLVNAVLTLLERLTNSFSYLKILNYQECELEKIKLKGKWYPTTILTASLA